MESKRRRILVFADWYLPGYKAGGPIRSVANLVQLLKQDFDFEIVTRDTDFGETEPYPDVVSDQWIEQDGVKVLYLSAANQSKGRMKEIMRQSQADVIYLNSLFSPKFTLLPLWLNRGSASKRPVVLAPRGMLGKGALGIKSGKKKLFLTLAKTIGLYKQVTWHASTALEREEVRARFGAKAAIKVANNLSVVETAAEAASITKNVGEARFLYLSRVAGIKHTDRAIRLVKALPEGASLDVYGPCDEPDYKAKCDALMANDSRLNYRGQVAHHEVSGIMQQYHAFLLPTENENFGHVIAEALTNGLPVIISDRTPWVDLKEKGVGYDLPFEQDAAFDQALREVLAFDQATWSEMSMAARAFGEQALSNPDDLAANRLLFSENE